MSERLEAIDEYMKAKVAFDKAKANFDTIKEVLKQYGTFVEGDAKCDVSVIERETISLKDLKEYSEQIYEELKEVGVIGNSISERLTVKIKESKHE